MNSNQTDQTEIRVKIGWLRISNSQIRLQLGTNKSFVGEVWTKPWLDNQWRHSYQEDQSVTYKTCEEAKEALLKTLC